MVNSGQKTAAWLICLVVFTLALLVRAYGADFGFFNGDERVNDAARVLAGDLIPGQHFYPPFSNYLIAVSFVGLFGFGMLTDMWASAGEFRQAYFDDPTPFYLAARYVTAALSAAAAPLFFVSARRLGLGLAGASGVALVAVVLPLSVFMAHIAKGDSAMAVACVAAVVAFLCRICSPHPRRWDIALGLATALALSYKQSALLVLAPLAVAMILILARRETLGGALKSFGVAVLTVIILWPLMNIGVLLDLEEFIAFQRIQTVMSIKEEDGFAAGLPVTWQMFGDTLFGLNPMVLALSLIAPLWLFAQSCRVQLRDALIAIWIANLISTLAISLLVGTRQPEHLFLPNLLIFALITGVVVVDMLRGYVGVPRWVVAVTAGFGLGLMIFGAGTVVHQARATPVAEDLADYLATEFPGVRVQTGLRLPVPQTIEAQQFSNNRLDRLAEKYGITMPPIAEERILTENAENALFWVDAPFVMSGLEQDEAIDADFPVVAHGWPIQPDEWQLDNWLSQDVPIFVVNNFDFLLNESRSSFIRAFHQELLDRCVIAIDYEARKPLFLEGQITVFDCRSA